MVDLEPVSDDEDKLFLYNLIKKHVSDLGVWRQVIIVELTCFTGYTIKDFSAEQEISDNHIRLSNQSSESNIKKEVYINNSGYCYYYINMR